MDRYFGRFLTRFAPRTARALIVLRRASESEDGVLEDSRSCGHEIAELRKEIDELRQDSVRIAELYDLVFERLKQDRPLASADDTDIDNRTDVNK